MIIEIGVINRKYITPITIGDIILPNSSPNLIQYLFKGVKNFEFNKPNIKKTIENISGII